MISASSTSSRVRIESAAVAGGKRGARRRRSGSSDKEAQQPQRRVKIARIDDCDDARERGRCCLWDEDFVPSVSSWADEVEAEEEEEEQKRCCGSGMTGQKELRPTVIDNGNDEEETEPTTAREEAQMDHAEHPEGDPILFLGGIIFTDLEKKAAAMAKAAGAKKGEKEIKKELRDLRIGCIVAMLEGFGEIKTLKKRWDRRYCHVVFANPDDATRAFDALTSPEGREMRKIAARDRLVAAGSPAWAAPTKYYVRWSTKEELMGTKKLP